MVVLAIGIKKNSYVLGYVVFVSYEGHLLDLVNDPMILNRVSYHTSSDYDEKLVAWLNEQHGSTRRIDYSIVRSWTEVRFSRKSDHGINENNLPIVVMTVRQ